MPSCCICYTTDPTYLFPTFVSALQARRHAAAAKADVAIFSFGAPPIAESVFARACEAEGLKFLAPSIEAIDGAPVMLARLFLTRFVPAGYSQFLYVDGDTQIKRSLDPLLDAHVPAGSFMAANDPMTFILPGGGALGRSIAQHLATLGISPHEVYSYFNTGVLRINRDGWEGLGQGAWNLFRKNQKASRFPDQDVLNVVGGAHRLPMSLAWNFPVFMRNSRVESEIKPRIYHFMSNPKPWHGVFPPWGADERAPYLDILRQYPGLAEYCSKMPSTVRLRYHLQQRYKKLFETLAWGFSRKRDRILDYEHGLELSLTRVTP